MRPVLGVLSDVHGNRRALEAVLADGARAGVERWWALGDLVAVGPDPVGVLEVLSGIDDLVATRGNTERYVLSRDRPDPYVADVLAQPELMDLFSTVEASFSWTLGALEHAGWTDWLADLPLEVRTELPDGTRVLGVHASPGRDDGEGISPHRPEAELREALAGCAADVVIAGHTHQPTDRRIDGVRVLNGGSVGNPITDDLRPSYLILHAEPDGHEVELRRVDYDVAAFLAEVDGGRHPSKVFIGGFPRGERIRFPAVRPGAPACAG